MTLTNAQIRFIRSLKDRKAREESGVFVVEGEKMVAEALGSGFELCGLYRRDEIGDAAMDRISLCSSPSPVLALVRMPDRRNLPAPGGLCLALDSVRDPGNMGTILRVADWFGVRNVYCSADCADIYNPKTVQATMGSLFRVNAYSCELTGLCRAFKEAGLPVYGTLLDGSDIYSSKLGAEGLLVMGNESRGISPQLRECIDSALLIPSYGSSGAESLNVAVATALSLSEFRRRLNPASL